MKYTQTQQMTAQLIQDKKTYQKCRYHLFYISSLKEYLFIFESNSML